jgi:hypothetical protein
VIKAIVDIRGIKKGQTLEVEVNEKIDWVKELLDELSDGVDHQDEVVPYLKIFISLDKRFNEKFESFVLINGRIEALHPAICVRSGDSFLDKLDIPVNAIVIDDNLREKWGYDEEITMFFEDEEKDLYTFENSQIQVKEILHEYLFLNKNPYPKIGGEDEEEHEDEDE